MPVKGLKSKELTMKKVKIRNAVLEDASCLTELSKQLGYPASAHISVQRLQLLLNSDEHSVLVACNPDRSVVGWIHVYITLYSSIWGLQKQKTSMCLLKK